MAGDPVQATLSTLNKYYIKTGDFLATQQEKIANSEYFDKVNNLNPFSHAQLRQFLKPKPDPFLSRLLSNIQSHKIEYISALSIGIGINSYLIYKKNAAFNIDGKNNRKSQKPKRRVPKLPNGARRDVALVVGSPTEPLTRLIALDFEKRGFIVYLTILDQKDFKYVESNPITDDINYLNFADSYSYEMQLLKFRNLLDIPVIPFVGAEAHKLTLKAVVFTPNLYFPIGPIENISIASWNRINERFSIYLKIFSSGLIDLMRHENTKTILITPNILSSLTMPYHAPESIFQNSLKHLFTTLSREIKHQGLSVTHVKLGNLNLSNGQNTNAKISTIVNSEIRGWDEDIKLLYANKFSTNEARSNPMKVVGKGTSLRELYNLLFDIIYSNSNKSSVVYCGTGARAYDIVARFLPDSLIELFVS